MQQEAIEILVRELKMVPKNEVHTVHYTAAHTAMLCYWLALMRPMRWPIDDINAITYHTCTTCLFSNTLLCCHVDDVIGVIII
jgi:hypothetical protein